MSSKAGAGALAGVRTVLFDVGNTLHHLDLDFIAATVRAHARPVTREEVALAEYAAKHAIDALFRARAGGNDGTRQLSYYETILSALDLPKAQWEAILAALREENQRRSLWRVMEPSTPEVLETLDQRGFVLGVVSNADGRVAAAIAEKGTAHHFRVILDSHVVGVEKPDPRIFQMALEACAAEASSTVYVGDIYEIDIRGARASGLTPILIDPLGRYGDVDCLKIQALDELLHLLPSAAVGSV